MLGYKDWKIEEMTGYKPLTTSYMDFSIADHFGISAIKDTFNDLLNNFKNNYKYLTELTMALNWKSWEHQYNQKYCNLYCELFFKMEKYCQKNFTKEELTYYYKTTD